MRFNCRPVGLDFIERAAYRFENVVELEATPEAVFDIFADGESWPRWFDGIQRVVWTSPEPRGVGTTRTVTLTTMTVYEHFLAWERGRRFAFRFEGSSVPLCRAGVEDYRLEAEEPRSKSAIHSEASLWASAISCPFLMRRAIVFWRSA